MKKVVIIIDGLGDIKYRQLGNKTPLEAARTLNLDFFAKNGKTGIMYPIKGIAPESGDSQFVILGNPLSKSPGRGIIEALGYGIKIKKNHTYARGNFNYIKGKKILKRANAPLPFIISALNKINKNIKIYPTKGYRCILEYTKKADLNNTNPFYVKYKNYSKAVDSEGYEVISNNKEIADFIEKAEKMLKNKTIIFRGASYKLPKVKKLKNWVLGADMPVEIGLGKLLGMKIVSKKNIMKYIKGTNYNVYFQIKGPDPYGHKGNLMGKIKAIEKVDRQLKTLRKLKNTLLVITSDHSTPCKLKRHSKDPVPILMFGKDSDKVDKFSETSCRKGSLGTLEGKDIKRFIF